VKLNLVILLRMFNYSNKSKILKQNFKANNFEIIEVNKKNRTYLTLFGQMLHPCNKCLKFL